MIYGNQCNVMNFSIMNKWMKLKITTECFGILPFIKSIYLINNINYLKPDSYINILTKLYLEEEDLLTYPYTGL